MIMSSTWCRASNKGRTLTGGPTHPPSLTPIKHYELLFSFSSPGVWGTENGGVRMETRFALPLAKGKKKCFFSFFILSASLAMAPWEDASKGAGRSARRGGRCASAASDARPETSRHRAGRICSRGAGMHTKCCAHEEWQETACEQPAQNTEASRGLLARQTDGRTDARTVERIYIGAPIRFSCAWILRSACGSRVKPGGVDERACRQ